MASSDAPLFDPSLLPEASTLSLPAHHTIRPLRASDYRIGMLDCLRDLTTVGDIAEEAWLEQYNHFKSRNDTYFMIVVEQDLDEGSSSAGKGKRIVGTGAVIAERKFIHNLGKVGHVEDIAVAKDQQGKGLGIKIIKALVGVAEKVGCYKVCVISLLWWMSG
jgi:glucosamine-phosphate N-acetyltransferase